jgi:hypothetical protein
MRVVTGKIAQRSSALISMQILQPNSLRSKTMIFFYLFNVFFLPPAINSHFKSHCNPVIWLQYLYNKSNLHATAYAQVRDKAFVTFSTLPLLRLFDELFYAFERTSIPHSVVRVCGHQTFLACNDGLQPQSEVGQQVIAFVGVLTFNFFNKKNSE